MRVRWLILRKRFRDAALRDRFSQRTNLLQMSLEEPLVTMRAGYLTAGAAAALKEGVRQAAQAVADVRAYGAMEFLFREGGRRRPACPARAVRVIMQMWTAEYQ